MIYLYHVTVKYCGTEYRLEVVAHLDHTDWQMKHYCYRELGKTVKKIEIEKLKVTDKKLIKRIGL